MDERKARRTKALKLSEYERVQAAADAIRFALGQRDYRPRVGVVLGSGLGGFAESVESARAVPYRDIHHFPISTVPGHAGRLVAGSLHGLPVAVLQGRVHAYEGLSLVDVVRPVRVLVALGARVLILTNAAGATRPDIRPGQLVLLRDHINMLADSPLRGPNDERFGPRFPDMSQAYDPELRQLAHQAAKAAGVRLREGVYACMPGPAYETPAEVAMMARLGADLVGMSTVPEVIAARHMGARVLGISCVTNYGAGLSEQPLSHDEVAETAQRVAADFQRLLLAILEGLAGRQELL